MWYKSRPVTYRNYIYGKFWNKILTTKPPSLILYYPIKNSMLKLMMSYVVMTSVCTIKHITVTDNSSKLSMVIPT